MLFLSDIIVRKLRKLDQQLRRGSLTPEQVALRILEYDPFDYRALASVGIGYAGRGDHERARQYYWRSLEANPVALDAYALLMVSYQTSDPELAGSLTYLAVRRALSQGDEVEPAHQKWLADVREDIFRIMEIPDEESLHRFVNAAALTRPDEPDSVTTRLFPYRLVQEVIDRPDAGMDREAVDSIVKFGSTCLHLLIGVLRDWARRKEARVPRRAEAALALLGEIGDEVALPAIRECVDAKEPVVTPTAQWAAARIAGEATGDQTVYDFCCGAVDVEETEAEAIRDEGQAQDRRIAGMLQLFLKDNVKSSEMGQTFKMFFGPTHDMDTTDDEQIAFFDWLLNDYVSGRFRRTITEEYLARNRERLGASDRKGLQEWAGSYCSLFEVQRVEKGVGVELKDLLMGGTLFVNDIASSNGMAPWDCVFTRVRKEGARTVFTAVGVAITPSLCPRVREWIVADKEASGLEWRPYLRANSHHIRQHCLEIFDEMRHNMRLVTAEGDEFVFGKAVYHILDRECLLEALEGEELIGAREDRDGVVRFAWFETPETDDDQARRVLGSLVVEDDRLILECQSRSRLKRGMAMLQKLAGAAIEEKLSEFKSPQSMMKRMPEPAPASSIPPEVGRQLVTAYKERHYKSWLDMSLPALRGRTPRQAARDAEGRVLLIEVLKLIENNEERERMEGHAWYDVGKLKAELGVNY